MDRTAWARRAGLVAVATMLIGLGGAGVVSSQAPGWQDVGTDVGEPGSFAEGWFSADGAVGSHGAGVRVDDDGRADLRGVVATTGAPVAPLGDLYTSEAFRLPCDVRPARTVVLPTAIVGLGASGPANLAPATLMIDPTGRVTVMLAAGPTLVTSGPEPLLGGFVTLDGSSFDTVAVEGLSACDEGPARVLWVAPTGDDQGPGTEAEPLATVAKALDAVRPGDTIRLTEGTYPQTETLFTGTSGTATDPITLEVAPGDTAVISGSGLVADPQGGYRPVLNLSRVAHWDVSGIEVADGPSVGISCDGCTETTWTDVEIHDNGDHGFTCGSCEGNTWTRVESHHNAWAGLQLIGDGTRDNLVQDSDLHDNRDPQNDFENADGLVIQNGDGTGNQVVDSRAWGNADDGFDLFGFRDPVTLTGNWSWENGVPRPGETGPYEGDGQGFKLGGDGTSTPPAVEHVLIRNVAWRNGHNGFHSSGQPGPIHAWHNTAYENGGRGFNFWATDPTVTFGSDLRNNLSYGNLQTAPMDTGPDTVDPATDPANTNSWTLTGVTIDASDFLSLDSTTAEGPRGPGGALPTSDFLRLDALSELVDSAAVIDVGDPDPDYGAFAR